MMLPTASARAGIPTAGTLRRSPPCCAPSPTISRPDMTSPTTATRRRTARPKLDAIAADAVDLAREALEEVTEPGQIGQHLRAEANADRLVTHVFECTMPGYRGWSWVAVLARAPRAKFATVAETALLPGDDAVLAPEWEPWSERLKPEDIGADDLLPYKGYDERLEHGYEATGDEDEDQVAQWELGLGRRRVLSPEGRADAAERWIEGDFGPRQTSGRGRRGTVAANCSSCGFLSLLAGSLRGEFGVCTNEWSPADGRVVHLGYGCGAHSETGKQDAAPETPRNGGVIVDELDVEYQETADGADTSGSDDDHGTSSDGAPSDAAVSDGATSEAAVSDAASSDAASSDGATSDAMASDGATSDAVASAGASSDGATSDAQGAQSSGTVPGNERWDAEKVSNVRVVGPAESADTRGDTDRSEEHTSELQSRGHLVCRLLLEKH